MIIQLNPPMPVFTPKGEGIAHFLIDYGIEHNLYWVVFITSSGECWTYQNPEIRAVKNITEGRKQITAINKADLMAGVASVQEFRVNNTAGIAAVHQQQSRMEFDHAP